MTIIGYHASHEQFAPGQLRDLAILAEQAGFQAAKTSDHFHPWSEHQAQSGFAWSWLGAAMQATSLTFGSISAPGYRYHPAILAQAAATCAEMFPDRLWLALGSGQAINESITGEAWPEKAERNARLAECVDIIRALFAGETVTHRGRVTVIEAKLYSRPARPVPLLGAAVTPATAAFVATWADGLLTTSGGDIEATRKTVDAFRDAGGQGKPVYLQHALSWAPTEEQAVSEALHQWGAACIGGEVNWDLRRPADFDLIGKSAREEDIRQTLKVSADISQHLAWLDDVIRIGADHVYLHNVGRNQREFIEQFGSRLPS